MFGASGSHLVVTSSAAVDHVRHRRPVQLRDLAPMPGRTAVSGRVDHGPDGTGEPLSVLLRPGNAGSNTAADHITVLRDALRQLPGQRLSYSVGFTLPEVAVTLIDALPETAWQPAYNADGEPRDGAAVVELTGLLDLTR